ncbi:hypothetical protein H4R18_003835 [Coemansia javaensis]|uniref:SET domain-containing protein n=1 Tax=Coemansia javaensis TaxID=2761396 RepID=A0A9W8HDD5_9FUNG|nr:hypothetical protein H4R18_003835 [Coemansia javaensis]
MAAATEPTVDAAAAAGSAAAAAAAAGKKKKAKKVVADNSRYQAVESELPVVLRSSHGKGRHAVAARDLPAGTLVAVEEPAAAIVRNQSFIYLCHSCFGPVQMKTHTRPRLDADGNEVAGQSEKVTVPAVACGECRMAAYCSERCQKAHAAEHGVQCAALAKCNPIATAHQASLEDLRAVLALIGRRAADGVDRAGRDPELVPGGGSSSGSGSGSGSGSAEPSRLKALGYQRVLDLNPNRHNIDRSAIKNLQSALRDVLALVPEAARIPLSEAVAAACIFSSNNHALAVGGHQILGLYPFNSLFLHHSCRPNCVFTAEANGALFVRTLRDVPADAELTVSYVELYQPREQRRRELLLTRHFWCKCRRCSTALSQSVDRVMDGIQCAVCRRGVMIFEETKEVQDINELMTDISVLDQEIQGKSAECETCPAKIDVSELVEVLKTAITAYGTAHVTMQQGDLRRARMQLERFIADYEDTRVLHPSNAYLINTYASLARVCTQLDDPDRAIRYTSVIVERMLGADANGEEAVPENYPRLAEHQMALGDLCLKQAKKRAANRTPAGRSVLRRYLKEARTALEAAHRARRVIYGENSLKAAEAKRLLDSAKKEYDEFVKATTSEKKKPKKQQPAAAAPPPPPAPAPAAPAPAPPAAMPATTSA